MPTGGLTPWSSAGAPARLWLRPWHIPATAAARRHLTHRIAANSLKAWRHVGAFSAAETATNLDCVKTTKASKATKRDYRNVALQEIPRFMRQHQTMNRSVPTLHLNGTHDRLTQGVPHNYRPPLAWTGFVRPRGRRLGQ